MLKETLQDKINKALNYSDLYDTANAICSYLGIGSNVDVSIDEWSDKFGYSTRKDFYAQFKTFKATKPLNDLPEVSILCNKICEEELVIVSNLLSSLENDIGQLFSFYNLFQILFQEISAIKDYELLTINLKSATSNTPLQQLILLKKDVKESYLEINKNLKKYTGQNGLVNCSDFFAKEHISIVKKKNISKILLIHPQISYFSCDDEYWFLYEPKNNCILNAIEKIHVLTNKVESNLLIRSIQRTLDGRKRTTKVPSTEVITHFLSHTNYVTLEDNTNPQMVLLKPSGKLLSIIEITLVELYKNQNDEYTFNQIIQCLTPTHKRNTITDAVYHSPILSPTHHARQASTYKLITNCTNNNINKQHNTNYFFVPINLLNWNIFEDVKALGHIESFLATKQMQVGDKLLLNVGTQDRSVETGVYAIAEIVSAPYMLINHPTDYCNNKLSVNAKIEIMDYNTPLIAKNDCKKLFKQFRTVHQLSEEAVAMLNTLFRDSFIYPDELPKLKELVEGAKKQVWVNSYERNPKARKECIDAWGCTCYVCGFNFEETYGSEFKNLIHVHHVKPLHEIGKNYKVNPETDLIPVCPNCHMALHSNDEIYTPDELRKKFNK